MCAIGLIPTFRMIPVHSVMGIYDNGDDDEDCDDDDEDCDDMMTVILIYLFRCVH